MTLQVIGAGLGRTGTHSLALALEKLGFGPCYTINELKKRPVHVDLWNEAMDGNAIDWDQLFQSYRSAVEWPTVSFLPQILAHYPQAQVVLTLRDADDWFESANATIFDGLELSIHNPKTPGRHRRAVELSRRLILDDLFGGEYRDKDAAIRVYQQHVRRVRDLVPPQRLLQFRVGQGWDPLCEFLEVPAPQEVFPRVNDRDAFLSSAPDWFKELREKLAVQKRADQGH